MCTNPSPPGAWELNRTVTVSVAGWGDETIDYRTLLAAVSLAETYHPDIGPDPALRAVEENSLPDGMGLGVASFGCIEDEHRVTLDPEALELAVRLARRWLGLDGGTS